MLHRGTTTLNRFEQSQGRSCDAIYEKAWSLLESLEGRFLDLGCGQGAFLTLLKERGKTQLNGCDAHRYAGFPEEIEFSQVDLNGNSPFPDESFDCVTALEVIEHLENPRTLIREMKRLVRPGGLIVVTTPNNESLTSLLSLALRGHYSAFADACYPAHITPVLEIDLRRMLTESGFEKIQTHFSGQGRVPGTSLHWPQIVSQGLSARFSKLFSDNFLIIGIKP